VSETFARAMWDLMDVRLALQQQLEKLARKREDERAAKAEELVCLALAVSRGEAFGGNEGAYELRGRMGC